MPPPPAQSFAARPFAGLALRAQPDRRLVSLVRDGYEAAFEEIVRRYGRPLGRYAAAIVTQNRAEDVTQDAFSKALLALRDTDKEIELRPWLYRIVRNTALNDLRDQPPATAPLHEGIDGVETPLDAAERREEINELVERLRALPDAQRAAIVMRELEGLSHEEIAAALGMTGGGARQAIHRARRKLRDGAGLLVPIPVLQYLLGTAGEGLATGGMAGAAAAGGAGGGGVALKAGLATVLVAGSVGTGVAVHEARSGKDTARAAEEAAKLDGGGRAAALSTGGSTSVEDRGGHGGGRRGEREPGGERGGHRHHRGENEGRGDAGAGGGPGPSSSSGPGPGGEGDGGSGERHSGDSGSGGGGSGSGHGSGQAGSGSSGSGSSGSGSGTSGGSGSSGGGSGGSGDSGGGSGEDSGSGGSGSGDELLDGGDSGSG